MLHFQASRAEMYHCLEDHGSCDLNQKSQKHLVGISELSSAFGAGWLVLVSGYLAQSLIEPLQNSTPREEEGQVSREGEGRA